MQVVHLSLSYPTVHNAYHRPIVAHQHHVDIICIPTAT